jgi:hypothetical protein
LRESFSSLLSKLRVGSYHLNHRLPVRVREGHHPDSATLVMERRPAEYNSAREHPPNAICTGRRPLGSTSNADAQQFNSRGSLRRLGSNQRSGCCWNPPQSHSNSKLGRWKPCHRSTSESPPAWNSAVCTARSVSNFDTQNILSLSSCCGPKRAPPCASPRR